MIKLKTIKANVLFAVAGCFLVANQLVCAEDAHPSLPLPPQQSMAGEYSLADFGPVKTPAEAQATLGTAISQIIAKGGGILVLAPGVAPAWNVENTAPSSLWNKNTVTIVDRRAGYESVLLPANGKAADGGVWAGRSISRTVRQPIDGAFGVHSTESIDTAIAGGTTSYYQPCLLDIKKGKDQRIYGPTIRGLFEGMQLILYAPEKQEGVIVKALGWDAEKSLPYAVADVAYDHPKGTIIGDKHVVNSLTITDHSQSDNQSMSLMVKRENYGIGDSFVIHAGAVSQGNIMSAAGDEGGLCYGADIWNDLSPFRSKVESVNWKSAELIFEPGYTRSNTLGTSRPVINMNTKKHVINGTVYIVAPGNNDPWDVSTTDRTGKAFESQVFPGGAIIGSKDCGWTDAIVGRFFTIAEPSEFLDPANDTGCGYTDPPDQRAYRWYQIQKLETRTDGTKRIYVERTRWYSRNDVVPKLYLFDNYTWDGHLKPLQYVIAPGAYVADVSKAWNKGVTVTADSPRTLKLAPSPEAGGQFDFEKGDPIVQAIGQDPWNVTGSRVRHFNNLPSTIEDSSFQAINLGRVAVDSAMQIFGRSTDIGETVKFQKDKQLAFQKAIDISATSRIGIRFGADVGEAAILFEQPHKRAQPIWWRILNNITKLSVNIENGDFHLSSPVQMNGILTGKHGGISGSATPSRNLRGIAVPVKNGTTECKVLFDHLEVDAQYALTIQPGWNTACAVVAKAIDGFTVRFEKPSPPSAEIDWFLVR